PVLGTAVGACEEHILPVECDRTDRALDGVGIDPDAAIVEEAGEPFPARERVADRLGELGLLADQAKLSRSQGSSSAMIVRLRSRRTARRACAVRPRMSSST